MDDNRPNQQDIPAKSFKDTLNLPETDFPIRANASVDDPQLLERWAQDDLYGASFKHNAGHEKYVLHDGPPYANGPIHLGHAYNKILKDITCKSQRMTGKHVPVTPGWDCHGLPIELKVAQENPDANTLELIKACRAYAHGWIDVQRQSFKDLGVLMDWARPYITMNPAYEAKIIESFSVFFNKGFIERKNKTVPWCGHCKTVLAAAEIEHKDRKDPSVYALFGMQQADAQRLFTISEPVSFVVWTTTPWTLPLNRAVMVKPGAEYVLARLKDTYIVVGARVLDALAKAMQSEAQIIKTFTSDELAGLSVKHPFINRVTPIIFDESVGLDEGTAFVHCAPGCGPIDYEIGVKNNLEIYSPITADARYAQGIEPLELEGMPVADGQIWVIKKLHELGTLFYKSSLNHSYPHCWRCRNGLIFRATPQWFFDLNKEGIKQHALRAIEEIDFIPPQGRSFLKATVENRWEWCLSRQRAWGAPIPALLCTSCDTDYLTADILQKVAKGVEKEGVEFWQRVTVDELIAPDVVCKTCGKRTFKKEQDILDVWFDAGISHYAVLYNNPDLAFPADIYLEGLDQHRGWFQSSLLTSLVLEGQAAMKTIMTHGYTVDAKGQKMSKSLGNVVAPADIIKKIGTDGLRLWVASIGPDSDPVVSDVLLNHVAEVYRKIRNTARFLLSNVNDFNPETDAVAVHDLLPLDYYALTQLEELNRRMIQAYQENDFTAVFHGLADYCTTGLSSFYLDISKDRLYCAKKDGLERRSAQTVMWIILDTMTRLMAPILSFTAEHISDVYQANKKRSIHLQNFQDPEKLYDFCYKQDVKLWPALMAAQVGQFANLPESREFEKLSFVAQFEELLELRSALLKAIEPEREQGVIKHSLEARIELFIDAQKNPEIAEFMQLLTQRYKMSFEDFMREFLIVSSVELHQDHHALQHTSMPGVFARVSHAVGTKCPRCWKWEITTHPDGLCARCAKVLE